MWVVVKIMVPFLGTANNRCRTIVGTPKGTLILTTTHILPQILDHPATILNALSGPMDLESPKQTMSGVGQDRQRED